MVYEIQKLKVEIRKLYSQIETKNKKQELLIKVALLEKKLLILERKRKENEYLSYAFNGG